MGGGVVIDCRAAVRAETGGVERWARELSARLPVIDPSAYRLAAPNPVFAHRLGHAWEQVALPLGAAATGADAILCPANLAPLGSSRNIVVIHDVAPLRFPGDFSTAYARWQGFLLPRLARRAAAVIVPSRFSRSEVVELLGVEPSKVEVVLGGVPDGYGEGVDATPAVERFGLGRPYVLTVASKVRRKNLGVLGEAARRLAAEGVDLVAVGGGRPQFGGSVAAGDGVTELGPVGDDLLPALYAGAAAFVLPSIYEGFGLPVCEAMSFGLPVVCSDRAALPEAAGGAALLVPPDDAAGYADALLRVVHDSEERRRLSEAGRERVRGLTWQATAESVHAVCRRVVGAS